MSLDTFSHTFHYVTHYTDPTTDINIPHSLHLTGRCRKLDFETYPGLHTNTTGSGDGAVVHMSWLESLTVSNITLVQQAVFKMEKNPKRKIQELTR